MSLFYIQIPAKLFEPFYHRRVHICPVVSVTGTNSWSFEDALLYEDLFRSVSLMDAIQYSYFVAYIENGLIDISFFSNHGPTTTTIIYQL